MATKNGNTVDVKKIQALYKQSATNKAVLDSFAARQKNSNTTSVDRLLALRRQDGYEVPRSEIIEFLRGLEAASCGTFIVGRKGQPSRFAWSASLISVGQAASGERSDVEKLQDAKEEVVADDDDGAAQVIKHTFFLRPNFSVQLELPSDLTVTEATRIGEFVRSLPFAR